MIDITDIFSLPKSLVVAVLRGLWWLGWEFYVQTVGWSIGWLFLRVLTLGRFPEEGLGEVDGASPLRALLVEVTGLALLAFCTWWLTSEWPHL